MESWYPLVIGIIAFLYIHSFNRFAIDGESGIRTHETIRQQILSLPR